MIKHIAVLTKTRVLEPPTQLDVIIAEAFGCWYEWFNDEKKLYLVGYVKNNRKNY